MDTRPRSAKGTYLPGGKPPPEAHRCKGTRNKFPTDLLAKIIKGFELHGSDGAGKDGLTGFGYYLAKEHPKTAGRIVEKAIPHTTHFEGMPATTVMTGISIALVPEGCFVDPKNTHPDGTMVLLEAQPAEPLPPPEPQGAPILEYESAESFEQPTYDEPYEPELEYATRRRPVFDASSGRRLEDEVQVLRPRPPESVRPSGRVVIRARRPGVTDDGPPDAA